MKNQTPPTTACLRSQQQLAIIPYNHQGILPVININNQPPKPNTTTTTRIINPSFRQKIFSNLMEEFQRHYTTDQLLTATFICVMINTSFSHLKLGFELLDKTGLSSSISPMVMSLFKYSFVIFSSFSIAYADIYHCPFFKGFIIRNTRLFGVYLDLPLAHFLSPIVEKYRIIFWYMWDVSSMACVTGFGNGLGKHEWHVLLGLYCFIQTTVFPIGARVNSSSPLVLAIAMFTTAFREAASFDLDPLTSSAPSLFCFLDKSVKNLLPAATERVKSTLKEKKIEKFKYAIGLTGTVLFQNFFQLTTFDHVKAFIYFATSWIANLVLINASDDFGILNFILGNMLGSTVSQYGLGIITWFTYGVCFFLYILGIKLKSMNTYQNIENLPRPPFLFWIFYCCIVFDSLFDVFHQI